MFQTYQTNTMKNKAAGEIEAVLVNVGDDAPVNFSTTLSVPVLRYFIPPSQISHVDEENRRQALGFKPKEEGVDSEDPMMRSLKHIENKKKERKASKRRGEVKEEEEESDEDEQADNEYGGYLKVWGVPTVYVSEQKLLQQDYFVTIPEGNYDVVFHDPNYGLGKYAGDTVAPTLEQVCSFVFSFARLIGVHQILFVTTNMFTHNVCFC